MKRSIYCGCVNESLIDSRVSVCGWVQTKRDMGGVVFIDLRDREGTLQVVFNQSIADANSFDIAQTLRNQSVISVTGVIRKRDEETYNPKLPTGTVELAAESMELLSAVESLPYPVDDATEVREDLRLKYRFIDLRRPDMIKNLKFRHQVVRAAREYLDNDGFIEVETPMLMKSTPEGARDYLVPSRVHPGCFYALPQSPQIFKQLLMVGSIDKYYQVARCFRDEDLRADRQPEFTQVDMEMSFVDQEDILVHLEKLFKYIFKKTMNIDFPEPFPRMTWHEAMDKYGSDKPDIRFDLPIVDVTDIAAKSNFSVFKSVTKSGGIVRAINVKGHSDFTRSTIENLTEYAQKLGAKGMAWIAIRENGEVYSILDKYFSKEVMQELFDRVDGKPGDFILFSADKLSTVRRVLGGLRIKLGDMLGLRNKNDFKFLIVTDFPQFEYSEEQGRFLAMHHPFTMPYEEDIQYLISDPEKVRAQAYDIVLNGVELGSGSIRIHRQDVQQRMFEALGFSDEQIEQRFGFMVNAFKYGTPPHGGFAFGLDRIVMLMLGAESLREVIAFPKNKDAACPMTDAPDVVDIKQLEELNLLGGIQIAGETGESVQEKKKTTIDVENVANLARISLNENEKEAMAKDMMAIVEFADQLASLDISDVSATAHVIPLENVFHEDVSKHEIERADLLSNAKTKTEEYIYVPRVVE